MNKKILILLGCVWAISGFSQKILNGYTPPQTVVDGNSIRMLPGFHANSSDGSYNNTTIFTAKIGNPQTETVLPSSTIGNANTNLGENYVYTRSYLVPVNTSNGNAPQIQSITYFDGLGRAKQSIDIKSNPQGDDLVTLIEYDGFGRQVLNYLPMPKPSLNGGIQTINGSNVNSYYGVLNAYSETVYEDSPLNKLKESAFPGEEWKKGTNTIRYEYKTNITQDGVKRFTPSTTWANGATNTGFAISLFPANQLFKKEIKDEDGNLTYTFTNTFGQTLLARKINKDPDGSTQNIDTYYVYNEYNQLAYIIPPLAAVKSSLSQQDLDKLCYQYRYDEKGRTVEKKLPGKGYNAATNQWIWDLMVYDKQDRMVAMQDANLKLQGNKWLYTQYDQFSRVVSTGICNSQGTTRTAEQTYADSKGSNNTTRNSNLVISYSGMGVYYNVAASYPQTDKVTALYSLNYYDTYPVGTPAVTSPVLTQDILTQDAVNSKISTKGLPTASFVKNIDEDKWTKNYVWYDNKGRAIATWSNNHLGGFTRTETELDFAGVPKKMLTYNSRSSSTMPTVTIEENFTYDGQYRLKKHEHEVVGKSPKENLAEYIYNDKDQLITKKVGGTGTPLQTVNYAYNIRGWMTDINDIDTVTVANGDLFAYRIRYTDKIGLAIPNVNFPDYEVKPKYNGNIAEVDWKSVDVPGNPPALAERYGYVYDGLNRMKAGFYQHPTNPSKGDNHEIVEEYDLNGNIKKLKRFAYKSKSIWPQKIDDLVYAYDGNKLTGITDSGNFSGYEGSGGAIDYDTNGNMTLMADKGITGITYNFLDLPVSIDQRGNNTIYTYRADGTKIKRQFTLYNAEGIAITTTEYLDGFHYTPNSAVAMGRALQKNDDNTLAVRTAGEEEIFRDSSLEEAFATPTPVTMGLAFFPTPEGFYDFRKKQYIYQYKDQVGNSRVSYAVNPTTQALEVVDRNDYYPFGMNFYQGAEFSATGSPLNYKFQEQELQETGFYSFKWRQYMPDVGRFFNIDPLSEKYSYQSHYNFSENRLTDGRELEGLEFENVTIDISKDPDVIKNNSIQQEKVTDIEGVTVIGVNALKNNSAGVKLSDSSIPTIGPMPETMGSAIAGFRDASAPVSLGIVGEIGKGIIDGALDAANYLRNVNPLSDQRDYNGLSPRMTNWDGVPLGGQEGLDRGVNGIMFFGSFVTGGASAEANASKSIVLGEGMGRVKSAARSVGAKWYQAWSKNFPSRMMTDVELDAAKARNARWLKSKIKKGYKIYDIGTDPNRPERSIFYELEQNILKETGYPTTPLDGF